MTKDDVIGNWLEGLAARGIKIILRNDRVWISPRSAWDTLSVEEVRIFRQRRPDILARLLVDEADDHH